MFKNNMRKQKSWHGSCFINIGKEEDDISFLGNLPGISVINTIKTEKSLINIFIKGYF